MIGYTTLQSIALLSDACQSFNHNCAVGIEPNREQIQLNLERSLMLVTAMTPHIGYDNAADVAKAAFAQGKNLRDVVLEKGLMSAADFDRLVVPANMTKPS